METCAARGWTRESRSGWCRHPFCKLSGGCPPAVLLVFQELAHSKYKEVLK